MTVSVVAVVAATLEAHRPYGLDCKCGRPINSDRDWSRHVAEAVVVAQREAVTITTVEQLKQCPRGSVVLADDGRPFRRWPAENGEDHWASGEIALPALLIWHPEWSTR